MNWEFRNEEFFFLLWAVRMRIKMNLRGGKPIPESFIHEHDVRRNNENEARKIWRLNEYRLI